MLNRYLNQTLAEMVALVLVIGLVGCNRASDMTTSSTPPSPQANTPAATESSVSKAPGLPSVTGTSTAQMSTADAAAQRLIDNARANLREKDLSKAQTLLGELQQKSMYNSLSAAQKANVDKLALDINATPSAQEGK